MVQPYVPGPSRPEVEIQDDWDFYLPNITAPMHIH
jgi:hypothetical protein